MQSLDIFPLQVRLKTFKKCINVFVEIFPRSECLVLSSCEERSQPGVVSGYKGCSLEPNKITLYNRHGIMTL